MEPHQNNLLSDPNSHYITSLYCLILHHSERYKKIFMCKQKVTDSVQSAADSQSVQSVTGRRSRSQISSLFLFIHQISDLTEVCYSCGFIKRSGHRVPRWLLVHSNESCSPGSHATDVFVLFQPRGLTSCRITAHMNGMKICFTFVFNLKGSDNTKKSLQSVCDDYCFTVISFVMI